MLDAEIEQAARGRDPLAELDVELGLAEGRRDLVLDDLHADAVADRLGALLEGLDAADVQALGGVELQRATTRLRLGRVVHDDVVDKVRVVVLDLKVITVGLRGTPIARGRIWLAVLAQHFHGGGA